MTSINYGLPKNEDDDEEDDIIEGGEEEENSDEDIGPSLDDQEVIYSKFSIYLKL
jgi:hypothetical protein